MTAPRTTCLIGVDIGTTNCKVSLVDSSGHLLTGSQVGYPTRYPHPGWAEQDPEDWYVAFVQAVRQCVEKASIRPEQVQALSVCGPAHNAVLLDDDHRVLQPVILWSDRRSASQARWLESRFGERIFQISYQPVNPSWTLAQLLWIHQNQPDIWQHIRHIVIGKDYLTYRLTGAWQTDAYDALGTQLFDAGRRCWSEELCEIIQLPLKTLPPVKEATAIAGTIAGRVAQETGLLAGTPVAVGSGDSVVEALGVGVVEPGQCIVKLGTSGTINLVTAEPHPHRQMMTYYHLLPDRWCTITATNSGAAAARWFSQAFQLSDGVLKTDQGIDQLAVQVEPGSGGLIFHPYLQGERAPYWDPHLRGDFIGITVQHQLPHFARAVLEGVAFSLRDCLDLLQAKGLPISEVRVMGGGARSAIWRQILADVLNVDLHVPALEATTYGAALVAGIASRAFSDEEQAAQLGSATQEVVKPDLAAVAQYERLYPLYKQVTASLKDVYHLLSEFYMPDSPGEEAMIPVADETSLPG